MKNNQIYNILSLMDVVWDLYYMYWENIENSIAVSLFRKTSKSQLKKNCGRGDGKL